MREGSVLWEVVGAICPQSVIYSETVQTTFNCVTVEISVPSVTERHHGVIEMALD